MMFILCVKNSASYNNLSDHCIIVCIGCLDFFLQLTYNTTAICSCIFIIISHKSCTY